MESNSSERDVRVDRYVLHKMTPQEKAVFEAEMADDAELRSEVQFRAALSEGLKQSRNRSLREQLDVIHNETVATTPLAEVETAPARRVGSRKPRWYLAAAASVILIMTFVLWLSGTFTPDDQTLFASYYERPAYSIDRGSQDDGLSEAANLYNSGEYSQAAFQFDDYLRTHTGDPYVRFMAAIAYLETGKTENAKAHFMEIIEGGGPLSNRATWYLSLTYVLEKDYREANFWLERLASDANAKPFDKKASKLLKEIN